MNFYDRIVFSCVCSKLKKIRNESILQMVIEKCCSSIAHTTNDRGVDSTFACHMVALSSTLSGTAISVVLASVCMYSLRSPTVSATKHRDGNQPTSWTYTEATHNLRALRVHAQCSVTSVTKSNRSIVAKPAKGQQYTRYKSRSRSRSSGSGWELRRSIDIAMLALLLAKLWRLSFHALMLTCWCGRRQCQSKHTVHQVERLAGQREGAGVRWRVQVLVLHAPRRVLQKIVHQQTDTVHVRYVDHGVRTGVGTAGRCVAHIHHGRDEQRRTGAILGGGYFVLAYHTIGV